MAERKSGVKCRSSTDADRERMNLRSICHFLVFVLQRLVASHGNGNRSEGGGGAFDDHDHDFQLSPFEKGGSFKRCVSSRAYCYTCRVFILHMQIEA